jgi:uncharacterized protein
MLAGAGGETFGPSTTGTAASPVHGDGVDVWLLAFLAAIAVDAQVAAARTRTLWVRGEATRRYAGVAVGGALLGVGAQLAGGCNLGHGMSGAAQLNLSSWLVVASAVAGIGTARAVQRRLAVPGEEVVPGESGEGGHG